MQEVNQSRPVQSGQRAGSGLFRACLPFVLVFFVLLYLGLRGLGAFLITGDPLKKGDAVVALGGGGEWRVAEAVRLVQERYGQWLVITEPGELEPGAGLGSRFFQQTAVEAGLSPNAILLTDGVQGSTYDEARAVLHLLEKHHLQSVIVVTDPFHTQRTRMIFREIFDGSGRTVRVHPVPDHWYRSGAWFLSAAGWGNTLREYAKLTGYLLGLAPSLD